MIWHYTIGDRISVIMEEGILRPATAGIGHHEKPILWFSANQFWETTANKMLFDCEMRQYRSLTMEETAQFGNGLFRFGIPVSRATRWPDIGKIAGIKARERGGLMKAGRVKGADPKEWYGIIGSIPVSETVIQEMRAGDRIWIDFDPSGRFNPQPNIPT